ncbi:hypothetical protein V5799_004999 [Amblyomma americanum]|uniref:Secreted protein n=1 Tax=Amblyomma americanum TaxID=6943 RepID=A0AAQ4D4I0_AMBAM
MTCAALLFTFLVSHEVLLVAGYPPVRFPAHQWCQNRCDPRGNGKDCFEGCLCHPSRVNSGLGMCFARSLPTPVAFDPMGHKRRRG